MGIRTTHLFHGFGTFVFFLYFTKGSSVPLIGNIVSVMKNDQMLDKVPSYLYENNITSRCSTVKYSEENVTTENFADTLLCLAFYDTSYKFCQYEQLKMPFRDMATFYTYIQDLFPGETEADKIAFCENVKNISFEYKKIQPLLSNRHLNSTRMCSSICFDLVTGKFNPLCAILTWNRKIDDDIRRNIDQKAVSDDALLELKLHDQADPQKPPSSGQQMSPSPEQHKLSSSEQHKLPSSEQPKLPSSISNLDKTVAQTTTGNDTNNAKKSNTNPSNANTQESINLQNNKSIQPETTNPDQSKAVEANHASESINKPSEGFSAVGINNGIEGSMKDLNDDIKTSTISDNTQDHDISANQDDLSRMDDDKLSNDPNDPDQLMDTGVPNQNIPEPSEQRKIIHPFHSINPDGESHFFIYFTIISLISVATYIGYHNKQKILAIVLEGRRSRNNRGRRRPSTANYRKLDCTLEEAVTSQCNANVTHVIY